LNQRKRINNWLLPEPDFLSSPDGNALNHRKPGTNAWFLEEDFDKWRAGNPKALLLHGGMGCGKTWLCAKAHQDLCQVLSDAESSSVVAGCYLSNTAATTNVETITRSLLAQLGMRDEIHPSLSTLYNKTKSSENMHMLPPTADQFRQAFRCVIQSLRDEGVNIFLLVDALDEIPFGIHPKQRTDITDLLNQLASSKFPNLRLLVTCQPQTDLMESLSDQGGTWTKRAFPPDRVQSDIERFVRRTVVESSRAWSLDVVAQEKLIERLAGSQETM
jgi:hypothetical protein